MKVGQNLKISAVKHPNIPHYDWNGELIELNSEYAILLCKPGRVLNHYTKGKTFTVNNYSIELYSFKEWFTVACQIEEGKIVTYYCNIAKPTICRRNTITYVDLDLDLVKRRYEFDFEVVDEDEFLENSLKFGYSPELIEQTKEALSSLQFRLKNNQFPFDGTIDRYIPNISYQKKIS